MTNNYNFENELIRKEVFATLETSDKEHPVIIYNPNQTQRKLILDLILNNINIGEEKITTSISGKDIIFRLLEELTNVHLGLDINNPEHQERVNAIAEDPSDLFLDISTQLNKIVNKQFYRYYDNLRELLNMPEELRNTYIDNLDKIMIEENKNNNLTEEEKQIVELEEKLKELKNKKEGK